MQEGEAQRGRIGVTMKVGVTGHIDLKDKAGLVDDMGAAVERLLLALKRGRYPQTLIHLSVVSALAEGADRVVAQELLRRGAELEVVLPLPADDYELDFESTKGRAEFTTLRREARRETVMPPAESRDSAYLLCGYEIVERSDVLLAVWDGKHAHGKGGTGDVVAYAPRASCPHGMDQHRWTAPGNA